MKISYRPISFDLALVTLILAVSLRPAPAAVGYVNVVLDTGLSLIANPLVNDDNSAGTILAGLPDGTVLFRFDPVTQYYKGAATYFTGYGWFPASGDTNDLVLNPGEGFFVQTPQPFTNTFVGSVLEGSLTNPIPANYSLKASMVPQTGLLQTDLKFKPVEGDRVWRWNAASQQFTPPPPYAYQSFAWSPSEPSIAAAESFFVNRPPALATPANWWIRNFNFFFAAGASSPAQSSSLRATDSDQPDIRSIAIHGGNITLEVLNPDGAPYAVQHSADGIAWVTIATDLTGPSWTGKLPAAERGYFQVVKP